MRYISLIFLAAIFLSSCVSNRKIVLMQKDDVFTKDLPKDSIVRTYAIDTFNYRLQANDIISVRIQSLTNKEFDFFNQGAGGTQQGVALSIGGAQLFGELIDENGEIPLPVVGKTKVAGLTIFQAQDQLTQIVSQYIESPIVKVRLMNYKITVLGEVGSEGTVTLSNNRVTMLEAIAQAGGLSELSDRSKIKLIRQKGGQTEVIYLNLLSEDFFNSPYYYVYQNDVLIVPPLRQRAFRRYFGQNLSLIVSTISLLLLTWNLTQ